MNALKRKQAFLEIKTTYKDPSTKLPIIKRQFDLENLKQQFILVLEKHEREIQETKEDVIEIKEKLNDYDDLKEQVKILTKKIEQLENGK